mmetsp:Transcript_3653/g.8716  ORF Transcript_3653/g.8716 Transcript_3653/m.8716 type:complete len:253 (+) Transcript_3653:8907-9665(+)
MDVQRLLVRQQSGLVFQRDVEQLVDGVRRVVAVELESHRRGALGRHFARVGLVLQRKVLVPDGLRELEATGFRPAVVNHQLLGELLLHDDVAEVEEPGEVQDRARHGGLQRHLEAEVVGHHQQSVHIVPRLRDRAKLHLDGDGEPGGDGKLVVVDEPEARVVPRLARLHARRHKADAPRVRSHIANHHLLPVGNTNLNVAEFHPQRLHHQRRLVRIALRLLHLVLLFALGTTTTGRWWDFRGARPRGWLLSP